VLFEYHAAASHLHVIPKGRVIRKLNPQTKDRRKVPIPYELRESMREVREVIKEADRDPDDLPIDFDDAIQVGAVCGGRIGSADRPFEFTYYPDGDRRHGRWFFGLHETEIEDIADGLMSEITMYCCTSPDCRCKFRDESETCFFCDYEDDAETITIKQQLNELAKTVTSKEEWVTGYSRIKPEASGMSLIGDYNPIDGLGDRLGWLSPSEAQELIDAIRSQAQDRE